jgi:hypothetical protein
LLSSLVLKFVMTLDRAVADSSAEGWMTASISAVWQARSH